MTNNNNQNNANQPNPINPCDYLQSKIHELFAWKSSKDLIKQLHSQHSNYVLETAEFRSKEDIELDLVCIEQLIEVIEAAEQIHLASVELN